MLMQATTEPQMPMQNMLAQRVAGLQGPGPIAGRIPPQPQAGAPMPMQNTIARPVMQRPPMPMQTQPMQGQPAQAQPAQVAQPQMQAQTTQQPQQFPQNNLRARLAMV